MASYTAQDDELVEVAAEDFGTDIALPPLFAHFFSKTARKSAEVIFTRDPSLHDIELTYMVADKREARALTQKLHATAWNF